jgi:hypothetical protein
MLLEELVNTFYGVKTTLQKEHLLRDFIGTTVEIRSTIANIEQDCIKLESILSGADYRVRESGVSIHFDSRRFSAELLSYSYGDDVVMTTTLQSADLSALEPSFVFELRSIRKTGTTYSSRKSAESRKGRTGMAVAIGAYWLVLGSGVGIATCYVLEWVFRVPLAVTVPPALVLAGLISVGVGTMAARSD